MEKKGFTLSLYSVAAGLFALGCCALPFVRPSTCGLIAAVVSIAGLLFAVVALPNCDSGAARAVCRMGQVVNVLVLILAIALMTGLIRKHLIDALEHGSGALVGLIYFSALVGLFLGYIARGRRRRFQNGDETRPGIGDSRTPQTSATVISAAIVMGAVGGFFFGSFGAMGAGFEGISFNYALVYAIPWAVTGAASGVSFVGMCALATGSELGRLFTYAFTVFLGGVVGPIAFLFLEALDVVRPGQTESFTILLSFGVHFVAIILGAVGGTVLSRYIRRYGSTSRAWGTIVALTTLPVGGFLSFGLLGGQIFGEEEFWIFLVLTLMFAVFWGFLGAVAGAIRDS